ncbi:site-specific integrase [Arthrobacter sp. efr-133-TYG-120]|uniref:site-specific integrase n=1 Tax=Arthrobacter sp. efr-133-TYG-120 TaxID=3040280 RepID=UPI00254B9BE1|nr:site-specific integrase [Arthrobacter sp. efr-133-TYG-120]
MADDSPRVKVVYGGSWDETVVALALGEPPIPVSPVLSPVLTVDGLIESDATEWLAHVFERTGGTKTSAAQADRICVLAEFLLEKNCSLRGATRKHIVAYVKHRTVSDARVSGATWHRDRSAIKPFYEWLRETYGIPLPFTLDVIHTPWGQKTSMREGRNVPRNSAAGTPIEPSQVPELLAAAWRIGHDGQLSTTNRTGARDAAFVSLGLACGARADTLTHLTIYELPDPSTPGDLVEMRLPGAISKTGREARLPAFRSHLQRVYDYANPAGGARRLLLKGWTPENPIQVAEPPSPKFQGIIDTKGIRRFFNEMTAEERRRLVTPEGEPAILFLAAGKGSPLAYKTAEELTGDISKLAEANATASHKSFPHIHTHDLRHTYATHLAALFMLGVATGPGRDMHGRPHRVDIRSAVQMACMGLGHINEATTTLYIQQVGMMILRYSANDFLGRA